MGAVLITHKLDAWFKDRSLAMVYVSAIQVEDAAKLQLKLKNEQGREPRLWECHLILGHMTIEQTDHVLNGLGRDVNPNNVAALILELLTGTQLNSN